MGAGRGGVGFERGTSYEGHAHASRAEERVAPIHAPIKQDAANRRCSQRARPTRPVGCTTLNVRGSAWAKLLRFSMGRLGKRRPAPPPTCYRCAMFFSQDTRPQAHAHCTHRWSERYTVSSVRSLRPKGHKHEAAQKAKRTQVTIHKTRATEKIRELGHGTHAPHTAGRTIRCARDCGGHGVACARGVERRWLSAPSAHRLSDCVCGYSRPLVSGEVGQGVRRRRRRWRPSASGGGGGSGEGGGGERARGSGIGGLSSHGEL